MVKNWNIVVLAKFVILMSLVNYASASDLGEKPDPDLAMRTISPPPANSKVIAALRNLGLNDFEVQHNNLTFTNIGRYKFPQIIHINYHQEMPWNELQAHLNRIRDENPEEPTLFGVIGDNSKSLVKNYSDVNANHGKATRAGRKKIAHSNSPEVPEKSVKSKKGKKNKLKVRKKHSKASKSSRSKAKIAKPGPSFQEKIDHQAKKIRNFGKKKRKPAKRKRHRR